MARLNIFRSDRVRRFRAGQLAQLAQILGPFHEIRSVLADEIAAARADDGEVSADEAASIGAAVMDSLSDDLPDLDWIPQEDRERLLRAWGATLGETAHAMIKRTA